MHPHICLRKHCAPWLLQMLPFTPISEQLLTRDWVATEYPIVAKALPTAAQGWKVVFLSLLPLLQCMLNVLYRAAAPVSMAAKVESD